MKCVISLGKPLLLIAVVSLVACGGSSIRHDRQGNVIPKVEKLSKYGNQKSYIVFGKRYYVRSSAAGYRQRGIASWYGKKFHGRKTSNGEKYNMYGMSAAHKTLPLPTYVKVTNLDNRRSVILRVNDRGPFVKDRLIDLSYTAAKKLGIIKSGTGLVEVRVVDPRGQHEVGARAVPLDSSKPATEEAKIFIQFGSFASRQNALNLKNRLNMAGQTEI
ncbi:MAG: septal ring lytic transglycosylase RlpA family protein, partial [Gammaproteobacteria bacterium]|nr:septal ring lytic transglycosylase RlpA family protein [Gammaproteobacteria bacterium]